jgi:1,2-dihydroxy-3-keto-5-methylthiopentene dioxygenase
MGKLYNSKKEMISNPIEIKKFMNERGILFEQWETKHPLHENDSQEIILNAYAHELGPFMKKNGFINADVINVHPKTPNLETIRAKFLAEHTHDEDEIRFFVDGKGHFYFHLEDRNEVFSLICEKGDFISVPAGVKHWFDLAPNYFVKAIRIFKTPEGWVARYTGSTIAEKYL